ncbi:MAG: hypothetical protein U0031_19025 [Thermomicrobiales bacterium]
MDEKQFAEITKAIAQETSRRGALARLVGGLVAGLGGAVLATGDLDAKGKGKKGRGGKNGGKAKQGGKARHNFDSGGGTAGQTARSLIGANLCPDGTSPKQCPAASGNEFSCKIALSGNGCDVNGQNPPQGSIQVCCEDDTGNNSCREDVANAGFAVPDAKFCYCNNANGCDVGNKHFDRYEVVGVEGEGGTCVPASCTCTRLTCKDLGANACGTDIPDGCGGKISCGCNDGDTCTEDSCSTNETGQVGECSYQAKDCSKTDGVDQCNEGYCDPDDGACKTRPVEDGTDCDDGLFCTVKDSCQGGVCVGKDRDCSNLDDQCNTGVCDEEANACVPVYKPGTCDDGLFCTDGDVCVEQSDGSGACQSGPARDCSHKTDQCNIGVCNEQADRCEKQPTPGVSCDDGLYCTVNDTCNAQGECVGTARDCSGQNDQCNTGVCNEVTDACAKQPKQDGTTCSDGKACTVNDSCQAGTCVSGSPKVCPPVECKPICICKEPTGDCECRANTCTRTQGYWKTHPELWDQSPAELVAVTGFPSFITTTPFFKSGKTYLNAMLASSSDGGGYYALAQQYSAALINIARGACVPVAILSADRTTGSLVEAYKLFNGTTSGSFGTTAQKNAAKVLIPILTAYNEGVTGPGHCG